MDEGLSRMLGNAKPRGDFRGITVDANCQLHNYFFYSILVFCDVSCQDTIFPDSPLVFFWRAMGMQINISK